jgi:hypothetical protein
MAGFREFVTGEVLTAANVNDFLAKQAVMKFADAAARDSALGTAVAGGNALREGMVAYLDDTDEVIKYDGSAWGPISVPIAGIGTNLVSTAKTDVFTTSATSYTDVTGLSLSITPTSATSKVLVIVSLSFAADSNNRNIAAQLVRDSTAVFIGDVGLTTQASIVADMGLTNTNTTMGPLGFAYLDSPATTSATTYKIQVQTNGGNVRVNQSRSNGYAMPSSITAIEVAA